MQSNFQPAYPVPRLRGDRGWRGVAKPPLRTPPEHGDAYMSDLYKRRFRDPKSARRDKELTIRLTREELESVRNIAAVGGVHMADLVRRRLLDSGASVQLTDSRPTLSRVPFSTIDPALIRQLASIGSNLNQIARAVNKRALQSETIDVIQLLAEMLSIERQLSELCGAGSSLARGPYAH